ncbi:TDRD5 protein, partial [Turnix velox]|nr:TDRD5 protein [Turnix velox]
SADKVQLMEMLKKEVRSLLMASKEGLTPAELAQEYKAMVGRPLPLRDLGFKSPLELVAHMPEVVRVCPYKKGTFILKAIADETTKAIADLVARQKDARGRRSASVKADSRNTWSFPQKGRAPILPGTVKAELQDLLSSSPLLLLDFNKAFYKRFGREFQYTQYGFSSISEVFESMSDIIVVEQTKAGSLLTLKKHLASEKEKEEVPPSKTWEEMPPLESTCETESFYSIAEEKSEPVETQAVDLSDGLKESQVLEQSLLAKLIMTPEIPPDAVQDRSLCSLPPLEKRCLVGVFVEYIVSPSQFYVHICSREKPDELQDMMFEMRHCYSNKLVSDRYIMPESSIQPGQLCCVVVSKWWYRVVIHRVINDREVEVFYPDYGNLKIVQKSWLRFLKWCYLKLPAQAIPCSLAWVKPVEGAWSNAATLLFKNLCGSKLLVGIVDEYVDGILHLFLCDTSTAEDVYLHFVLRDEGYADVCRENVPSQGFAELNPWALYVQPSGKQENAELVEPDFCLKQESLDTNSETACSDLSRDELSDQQWHLPAEETEDDVQIILDEVSVPETADQDPELAQEDTNETLAELVSEAETPHFPGESSLPAVTSESVEELRTSFIHTNQPAEMSQDDPDQIEKFSSKAQLSEDVHPSVLLMAIPFMLDNQNSEEKTEKTDLPMDVAVDQCSASGLSDQRPPQKLYVPPTTLSTVLAAARLATSSDYFQWSPSLRQKV